jgi:hypothetical protein
MDDTTKTATAAAVYRYLVARAWFRLSKLPRSAAGPRVTPESLGQDLTQGRRLLADGVLVYPQASLPIVGDDQDPDFLSAIAGHNGAIDIDSDQLETLRSYILRGGDLPRGNHQSRAVS